MLCIKDSHFDPSNETEAQEERLKENVFIRDVIRTICKDTLDKARRSNQVYNNLSKQLLLQINRDIGDRHIDTKYYTYRNN